MERKKIINRKKQKNSKTKKSQNGHYFFEEKSIFMAKNYIYRLYFYV